MLVWSVNLITGAGLILLGTVMRRRPERIWVGVRPARNLAEATRIRRANGWASPWLLILGAADVLTGPIALLFVIQPLTLAFAGLIILLLAIVDLVIAAFLFRGDG